MHKVNTILLLLILLLTGVQIFFDQSGDDRIESAEKKVDHRDSSYGDVGVQIAALSAELRALREEMALLSGRLSENTEEKHISKDVAALSPNVKVEAANVFFDKLIASGSLTKNDIQNIGMHLPYMNDAQKQAAMERLATAINSKEVVIKLESQ